MFDGDPIEPGATGCADVCQFHEWERSLNTRVSLLRLS